MQNALTIGELSARSGVAPSALRYYERLGLIWSSRTGGNQRRYERAMLRRVAFIRVSAQVGIPLEEIRAALASLGDGRTPTKADWTRLSRAWRSRLDERIALLEKVRDQLDDCIGCGCLSLKSCGLYNRDDELASKGPGPVKLLRRD
ncbi:redox-sensitive transcriptional activator SoxR [Planosporangium thailandense]|uniref:Redox-sensitive transcriptional activator SoxR n=1 Tax=Planosporangium thailandense TaxID=765197 RepID=A0ABX0XSW3_9ACTN|nr:redox-sensitive transcriptional activator SoxR [Planosporangium thailandense]NJC69090.1 redox-sensitive transcriptional activator SoxR [Planosporangium thailandense]